MFQITANPNVYTAHVAVTQHCAKRVLRCTSATFKQASFASSKLSQRPTSGLGYLRTGRVGQPRASMCKLYNKIDFYPPRFGLRAAVPKHTITSRRRLKVNTFSAMFSGGESKCSHSPTKTHRMSTAIRSSFFPCSVMFPPLPPHFHK